MLTLLKLQKFRGTAPIELQCPLLLEFSSEGNWGQHPMTVLGEASSKQDAEVPCCLLAVKSAAIPNGQDQPDLWDHFCFIGPASTMLVGEVWDTYAPCCKLGLLTAPIGKPTSCMAVLWQHS